MDEHYLTRCKTYQTDSLQELAEWFNEFIQGKQFTSTQIFNNEGCWDAIVFYKILSKEITPNINRFEKEEESYQDIPDDQKATEKQINWLKKLGYKGTTNLTKREAYLAIKEKIKEQHKA